MYSPARQPFTLDPGTLKSGTVTVIFFCASRYYRYIAKTLLAKEDTP